MIYSCLYFIWTETNELMDTIEIIKEALYNWVEYNYELGGTYELF